ncbi:hypothetical protein OH77DRAFT_1417142 [Trametes cingulata]|nr:hypothetical protein OH77DRAFT_1417142 [Trametes cingulata]
MQQLPSPIFIAVITLALVALTRRPKIGSNHEGHGLWIPWPALVPGYHSDQGTLQGRFSKSSLVQACSPSYWCHEGIIIAPIAVDVLLACCAGETLIDRTI